MAGIKSEPALITGLITSVVGASITLGISFGLDLTKEQIAALTGFITVVAPIIAALVTRTQVTPAAEVAVKVNAAGDFVAADAITAPNGSPVDVFTDPVDGEEPQPL